MSFFEIIETLLIGPLKLLFEIVFVIANKMTGHPGVAIIFLSLVINLLVLPLYRRADAMQEQSRETEAKLHKGVAHIKKVFSGDERMMILQTYYRQNHYKPADALRGSASLLLEIPFFIAAYQFLSHLETLSGASFGVIADLSAPDGIFNFPRGGGDINILPLVMTLINLVSSYIYSQGFPLKTKIQLYGMALFFLVFLYHSPSGLVFYWTLNNVFSLVKTCIYKLKLQIRLPHKQKEFKPNPKLFEAGSVFLTILLGLLIPSNFIAASPQEYVDITYFHNPVWYIVDTCAMAAGAFMIWMCVFYWLTDSRGKVYFDRTVWVLCSVTLVDYMFFGTHLGIISPSLQYEMGMNFSLREKLLNIAVLLILAVAMYLFISKWGKARAVMSILSAAVIAIGAMSVFNVIAIKKSVDCISVEQSSGIANFQLSTTGRNVIVLMLDRALGEYVPYMLNEKPELKEKFSGFTYYANTISFGAHTTFGVPAMLGGYEYTPVEMNRRGTESLVSKHDEALKVLPVLFDENGYDVTVCDPPYANYQEIPDLSIFDEYPEIDRYITKGVFSDPVLKEQAVANNHRNFTWFSLMKTLPLFLQPAMYAEGTYNQSIVESSAVQMDEKFEGAYNVLINLANITKVTKDKVNTFLFLENDTTHEAIALQTPDYVPAEVVDNSQYDMEHINRFTIDGRIINLSDEAQVIHYDINMAVLLRLGEWLDYLRKCNVYDNTRIIIASDHGRFLYQFDELMFADETDQYKDVESYYPLLLFKDFDSAEFTVSDEFMTNADVPTLATEGIIENPVNPFTGKVLNNDEKTAHKQYIIMSDKYSLYINDGNTFLPARWACVQGNLWNRDEWEFYEEEVVLNDHVFPSEHGKQGTSNR